MRISDWSSDVCSSDLDIWTAFEDRYLAESGKRFQLVDWAETHAAGSGGTDRIFAGQLTIDGAERSLSGRGNGLMPCVIPPPADSGGPVMDNANYLAHAIRQGASVQAPPYVEVPTPPP